MNTEEVIGLLKEAQALSTQEKPLGLVGTGSLALNRVVSGKYDGGIPIGCITEIMGESSTGKTLFLTHILAEAQKKGYYTLLADNEFSYNMAFAESMGVDSSKLLYCTPASVPDCFRWAETVVKEIREHDATTPIVFGLDSMAGQSDIESGREDIEFNNMDGSVRAKEIGSILRQFRPKLRQYNLAVVLINQIRSKVGVMYGDTTARSGGGKALEFYDDVWLQVKSNKSTDLIRDDKKLVTGIKGSVVNKKNRISTPFQECDFEIDFSSGMKSTYGLTSWLEKDGIVERNGGWYTVKASGKKFQAKEIDTILLSEPTLRELIGLNE